MIVTLDSRGGAVFFKEGDKVRQEIVKSVKVDKVIDTTGCGDSFAGGLGFGLLEDSTNYLRAAKFGNALGALRTQGRTFDVFKSRKEIEKIILDNYGNI